VTLADRILAAVEENPGMSSSQIASIVGARKADVLAELDRLGAGNHLEAWAGQRRAKAWHPAPSGSLVFSAPLATGPQDRARHDGDAEGGGG
jgi:hypothetical protein